LVFSVLKFKVAITSIQDLTWSWLLRVKPALAVTAKPFDRARLFTRRNEPVAQGHAQQLESSTAGTYSPREIREAKLRATISPRCSSPQGQPFQSKVVVGIKGGIEEENWRH